MTRDCKFDSLQHELYIDVVRMGGCVCVCVGQGVCMGLTKSTHCAWKLIFGAGVVLVERSAKCQKDVSDLDLDLVNEVKCGGHEILIDHISGSSPQRTKMFSVPGLPHQWL